MNLLYSNDTLGQYPDSWYAATTAPLAAFTPLDADIRADVCIIGAGYTGLSAALALAERGYDVVILEAQRVGFGASGRNGGWMMSAIEGETRLLSVLDGDRRHLVRNQSAEDFRAPSPPLRGNDHSRAVGGNGLCR